MVRSYRSRTRTDQSAALRARLVETAAELFDERGYLGTTVADAARGVGISPQSVYNLVGGKPQLLKAAYDRAVAGDGEPVPVRDRPLVRAMVAADDPADALRLYARLAREIGERTHRLVSLALAQAASGDADLVEFAATIEGERGAGTTAAARHLANRFGLPEGLDEQQAADVLWAVTAPELAHRLVADRGWSWDRYESWVAATMITSLVVASDRGSA